MHGEELRAADIQHRIDVHNHIESLDIYEDVWHRASRAGRGGA